MVTGYVPDAGHIIKIDLDPHFGHEQGGWRPALVLSPKMYNSKTGLAVVVPITNAVKGYPFEVSLPAGSKITGVVLSDAVKNVDWRVRNAKFAANAPPEILKAVRERLMVLLEISEP